MTLSAWVAWYFVTGCTKAAYANRVFYYQMVNVDEWYIDNLDPASLGFVLKIARFMKSSRMTAWPSIATLERVTGWSEDTVKKYRTVLVDKGILYIDYRPGTTPIYTFRKAGIGIFFGLENNPIAEELLPPKITPPKNYPPQKLPPEVITNTLEVVTNTLEVVTDVPPTSKAKKTKAKKSAPGAGNEIKKMAEAFDEKLIEKRERPFAWKAGEGRNFAALKTLKELVESEIVKAGRVELNEQNFNSAYGYILEYGYEYLKKIANSKGGAVEFKPSALLNNYNSIISYAKEHHRRTVKADSVHSVTSEWNDYGND